jgi:uncharacterized protein YecE (DUF72 family)
MALYVGTSGWAYREWKPGFYPADLPQRRFLEHYAHTLSACEINSTFYRIHSEDTVKRWAAAAPADFRYAAKAHRMVTHARRVATADYLKQFMDQLSALGPKLGAVLFQFPAHRERDDASLRSLLDILPPGPGYAFDFRHPSWDAAEVSRTLESAGGARCLTDWSGDAPAGLPPGRFGYVRLRVDRYGNARRGAWRDVLLDEAERRDVFVFVKHEGHAAGDPHAGVGLATWLRRQALRRARPTRRS